MWVVFIEVAIAAVLVLPILWVLRQRPQASEGEQQVSKGEAGNERE
jgi:hypothetical protein